MLNPHQDTTIVTTKACPRCGQTATLRVDRAELRAWIDADGDLPIIAAFPSLSATDHLRLTTGVHEACSGESQAQAS